MKLYVVINGKEYPCDLENMGAPFFFRAETGHDVNNETLTSPTEATTFLWACVRATCKREGIAFNMPLEDFACSISAEELNAWIASVVADPKTKKKTGKVTP